MEVELLKKYGSVSPGKIENLDGTTETVDFRFSTEIRFYHNMEDADFPLHWHAPGEIISPIEGPYTVTIAGKTVTLQPHDVLIIASGELHSIRAPKTGKRYIMNYSVSYFHQIQDMAELFNTFYPFRLVTRQEDPELADQLFAVLAQIEGEYFRISHMLSVDYQIKMKINKREFLDSLDRATLLIKDSDKKPIRLSIDDRTLGLKISSLIGSLNEEIDIEKEGNNLVIGFNPKLIIDALRVIDDENVTIYFNNTKSPCVIKDDAETYIYLILPMGINEE